MIITPLGVSFHYSLYQKRKSLTPVVNYKIPRSLARWLCKALSARWYLLAIHYYCHIWRFGLPNQQSHTRCALCSESVWVPPTKNFSRLFGFLGWNANICLTQTQHSNFIRHARTTAFVCQTKIFRRISATCQILQPALLVICADIIYFILFNIHDECDVKNPDLSLFT